MSFSDKPTPLDFDTFIPWICLEWQVPEVITIIRLAQEKGIRDKRSSSGKKSIRSVKVKEDDESSAKKDSTIATAPSSSLGPIVPIKAYYDSHGHLAEIAIDTCFFAPHRKVIQAISLCIPFHSYLTKLVIRRGGLNYILLYEISKLLPHSNLTDICLDDTHVPEGNYYILLDHASNLKCLSLSRCQINDDVCKELALRLGFGCPAEKSLAILDLSSNFITDVGAKYFGDILRNNRHLLHLNFLGNKIGDTGLDYLLKHLQEFPLKYDEILDKRKRSFDYHHKKREIYEYCVEEIARLKKTESQSLASERRTSISNKQAKIKKGKKSTNTIEKDMRSQIDLAERMTKEIMGDPVDPFDEDNCINKDDYYYSIGNFKLCSINLSYNKLEFLSLLKLLKVLQYQCTMDKTQRFTGLLRIVLEGNYLPNSCPELESINMYLKRACTSQIPLHIHNSPLMKRGMSHFGKFK